ncbi:hypothetical protein DPMN_008246 [Dreissena polymorpha]|uniref:Uncharacterized protein n=1 Tax=Dreissena polymorpha TaxID=45954 RepID=A0A9D4MUZ3_DREPO|nr:hypothetical protein DPMN_008246 [Dreissena polymorpha]
MLICWSVRVATEARVARRRSSHLYIFPYRGELLRVALLIQLSPPPSSRTSSTLLELLSSPRCSGLVNRFLSSRDRYPDLPEVPSVEGREQRDSEITSVEVIRGGPGTRLFIFGLILQSKNIEGWPYRGTWGGGTQCAQRTGETVSGMKTTAGDIESGHKGRAACCTPLAELRAD